jgi:hypothetical protein
LKIRDLAKKINEVRERCGDFTNKKRKIRDTESVTHTQKLMSE